MFSIFRGFFLLIFAFAAFALVTRPAQAQYDRDAVERSELEAAKTVAQSFLASVRQGKQDKAASLVAPTASDELASGFTAASKALKAAPPGEFKFAFPKRVQTFEPVEYEIELVYSAKADGKWTTALVRVYRYDDDPYRVEYWQIDNREPNIAAMSGDPVLKQLPTFLIWTALGIALAGIALIMFIIWLVRRKPHVIIPETETERRVAAITRREDRLID